MHKNRLVELDALRGIAALSVVLYHFFYRYDEIYGHKNLSVDWSFFGQFGVHLFFIVSGFVIYWTINRIERPMDFVVSRFSRLYPTYWVAVLTTFIIVYCFGLKGREVSFEHALYNILMFQEMLRIPHVDGVYWTLTVELIFYFWVFLLFVISKLEYIEGICTSVIFISVLNTLEVVSVPIVMYKLFLMEYLPLFLAGICFYKIINEENFSIKTRVTLLFSFMALCVIHSLEYSIIFILFTLRSISRYPID
ncbi:acyltransferase family protein [Vibrio taketomensis]|uniref:acyltransferase family protein n=1 Tax=Vibrio taketomensis TaxID=2572923 RepID=UPI001389B848